MLPGPCSKIDKFGFDNDIRVAFIFLDNPVYIDQMDLLVVDDSEDMEEVISNGTYFKKKVRDKHLVTSKIVMVSYPSYVKQIL